MLGGILEVHLALQIIVRELEGILKELVLDQVCNLKDLLKLVIIFWCAHFSGSYNQAQI